MRELMTGYLRMRLLSCGFAIGLEALGNYYGGLGNTRLPMAARNSSGIGPSSSMVR